MRGPDGTAVIAPQARCSPIWPRSCGWASTGHAATRSGSAPAWAPATPRRTRSACTSPACCWPATAVGTAFAGFAQQQLNYALGANPLGQLVRGRRGQHLPALHAERDRQPGRLADRPRRHPARRRPSTAPAARATSPGSARSPGCGPARRAATGCSTPRRPPTRTTWSAGRRSSRAGLHGHLRARLRPGPPGTRLARAWQAVSAASDGHDGQAAVVVQCAAPAVTLMVWPGEGPRR